VSLGRKGKKRIIVGEASVGAKLLLGIAIVTHRLSNPATAHTTSAHYYPIVDFSDCTFWVASLFRFKS
jgi:hypothetical protein